MKSIIKVFDKIESIFLILPKIALLAMMLITSLDALGRYLFNSPIIGAYEFTERYLMIVLVFLSMGYVMKVNGHIRLDLVIDRFPKKSQSLLNIIYYILGAIFMFVIGYQGAIITYEAWVNNQVGGGIIAWPYWLSYIWIPIGSFLFVIRLILLSVESATHILRSENRKEERT